MARIVIVAGTEAGQDVAAALMSAGHEIVRAQTAAEVAGMNGAAADVLFVECWLQGTGGATTPADVPVVLIAPQDALTAAVEGVNQGGAYDLLRTPCSADEVRIVARRALRYQELLNENRALRQQLDPLRGYGAAAGGTAPGADAAGPGSLEAARSLAGKPLADIEKQVILSTLEQFKGHRLRTAHALGIGVRTLGMKIKRWREEGEPIAGRQHRPPVHLDVS
jgi:DNA-binding NtrC family response regulator